MRPDLCRRRQPLQQARHVFGVAFDVQRPVRRPHDELALLLRTVRLRSGVLLVPRDQTADYPAAPLDRVIKGGQLTPVDEDRRHAARLHHLAAEFQPVRRPAGPGSLVHVVAFKGVFQVLGLRTALAVFFGHALHPVAAVLAAAAVGRVGDQRVEAVLRQRLQHLNAISVQDFTPTRCQEYPSLLVPELFRRCRS